MNIYDFVFLLPGKKCPCAVKKNSKKAENFCGH